MNNWQLLVRAVWYFLYYWYYWYYVQFSAPIWIVNLSSWCLKAPVTSNLTEWLQPTCFHWLLYKDNSDNLYIRILTASQVVLYKLEFLDYLTEKIPVLPFAGTDVTDEVTIET